MPVRLRVFACILLCIAVISLSSQPATAQPTDFPQPPRLVLKWKWGTPTTTPALLNQPWSVAVTPDGVIFIADTYNDRIQKFDAAGNFLSMWGQHGTEPGQFFSPQAVALDQNGNVLVSDTLNYRIQRFTPDGVYLNSITSPIGFYYHRQMVVDPDGNLYVSDASNGRIQKFDAADNFLKSWEGGSGCIFFTPAGMDLDLQGNLRVINASCNQIETYAPDGQFLFDWPAGPPCCSQPSQLSGLAVAADGRTLIVDEYHHLVRIFSANGDLLASFGSYGAAPGQFNRPAGIALGPGGKIYVADAQNNRLQVFDATGTYLWSIASNCPDCLNKPDGIATDRRGKVFVADSANNRVLVFDRQGKFQKQIGSAGSDPGKFYFPNANDLEFDAGDHLYVADSWNDRIQKFDTQGNVERIWPQAGGYDIAVDQNRAVYLAEQNNRIVKFGPLGERLLAWGSEGSGPGQFNIPRAIETDRDGNVWVGDWFNRRVQKFDPQGNFLLEWSPPNAATYNFIAIDIAIDPLGRINILDSGMQRILVIDTDGNYITGWLLGQLTNGELGWAGGLSYDRWGNLYVSDYQNGQIFRFQLRPYDLSVTALAAGPGSGDSVASLSANAPENSDPYRYALVDGPGGEDNALFTIQGSQLRRTGEARDVYQLRVSVTNPWGDTFEKSVQVQSDSGTRAYLPLIVH
jgi:DNA-binding beta-propeller fold protein YncE